MNKLVFFSIAMLISWGMVSADMVSLSGTVTQTGGSSVIAGAAIRLVRLPRLYAETAADGAFKLTGSGTIETKPLENIPLRFSFNGKMLIPSRDFHHVNGIVEIFSADGKRQTTAAFTDWEAEKCIALPEFNSGVNIIRLTVNGRAFTRMVIRLKNEFFFGNASFDGGRMGTFSMVKQAAVQAIDTLIAAKDGYLTKKIAIDRYTKNGIAVTLDSAMDVNNGGEAFFRISIDSIAWNKWEFKYPITLKFNLTDVSVFSVARRDSETEAWQAVPVKNPEDFFNGLEAARLDTAAKMAYISVGFNTRPSFYIKFRGNGNVSYGGVARLYDNRKAAYTLSLDNWAAELYAGSPLAPGGGSSNSGKKCDSMTDDSGDKYEAAVMACRHFNLPVSVGIVTAKINMASVWPLIKSEVKAGGLEPAVHTRTHPCQHDSIANYNGAYQSEILGCRDDLLANLTNIPYGNRIFEFIVPCGVEDPQLYKTCKNQFLLIRYWSPQDSLADTIFAPWDTTYDLFRGCHETKAYDKIIGPGVDPKQPTAVTSHGGRYYAADVAKMDSAFSVVYNRGGIFYAMWHPDRYTNSVIYDNRKPVEGSQGSSLMQHLSFVANRIDVWYVANGWMYDYHRAAELVTVDAASEMSDKK